MCVTCGIALRVELGDVPALLADLDVTRARLDQSRSPYDRSRGGHDGLPFRPHIGPILWDLHQTLTAWTPGRLAGCSTAQLAQWLYAHVDQLRGRPDAAQLVDEITYAIHRARHAIDRRGDRRRFLGPCGNEGCREELYGLPWLRVAQCPACSAEHNIAGRQELMREQARLYQGTAQEIAGFLRVTGMDITAAMIRGMAHRGRLDAQLDRQGHKRYRIRDVLDAIQHRYQRQRKQTAA